MHDAYDYVRSHLQRELAGLAGFPRNLGSDDVRRSALYMIMLIHIFAVPQAFVVL